MTKQKTFSDLLKYLSIFKRYVGYKIFIASALSFFAALAEGLGFIMIMPVLELLDSNKEFDSNSVTGQVVKILEGFGWDGSQISIIIFVMILFITKGLLVFAGASYTAYLSTGFLR